MSLSARRFAILALLTLCLGASGALRLSGPVPVAVDSLLLEQSYGRIWRAVAPGLPVDTAPVEVIYYRRSDPRPLGSRLPEWGGGGAIGRDTVVVPIDRIPLLDMDAQRITTHELVHIALARAYGSLRIPRWFHEGLAMTLSGELSFDEHVIVSRAIFTKGLLPLDTIDRVNLFSSYGAQLAYAQSHLAMLMVVETWGLDGIPEILDVARRTRSFSDALVQIVGLTPDELERMVISSVSRRYRYVFLAADTYLYWLGLVLLAMVAFVVTRFRNRARLALIEREEMMEESGADPEWSEPDPGPDNGNQTAPGSTDSGGIRG